MFLEVALKQCAGSLENIRVLDLCGAPGGKSTHLSSLIGQGSLLVSNEVIRMRAVVLAETLTKWGATNALVTQNDPALFGKLSGYFDIILVDAPCSGEGMFRSKVAVDEWSVENSAHCSERQKRILMDVWPALKENGILIYSTCTFNPGENEENIKWLLTKHEAECVPIDIGTSHGIVEIDYQGINGYGFHPGMVTGEGFFLSVVRKNGKQDSFNIRGQRRAELKLSVKDKEITENWTSFSKDNLLKWGDEIFAVPCEIGEYTHLFQNLKVIKAGTKLAVVKNSDFLPSHELALSHKLKRDVFPVSDIDLNRAMAFLRRDNFVLPDAPKGWNLLAYQGVAMGFVKNIGSRVNNYYPVEWRIRMNLPQAGSENIIKWEGDGF